jgi:ABC-type multidrug transport system fused ATPase/permease subunit
LDIERLIVSKVAQSGRIERLVSAGYDEYHFHQDDCRNVWKFSVDYLQKYHSAPSFDSVKHEFPAFEFELSTEPLEALSDKFLKVIKKREAVQGIRDIAAAVDDPNLVNQIDDLFLEKARHVSQRIPSESRVVRFSEMPTRIDDYKRSAEEGLQRGLTTGIPQFDEVTLGIQPHEFVSIVGWQGRGKSTLLQLCFFHQYLDGATPMLISLSQVGYDGRQF